MNVTYSVASVLFINGIKISDTVNTYTVTADNADAVRDYFIGAGYKEDENGLLHNIDAVARRRRPTRDNFSSHIVAFA